MFINVFMTRSLAGVRCQCREAGRPDRSRQTSPGCYQEASGQEVHVWLPRLFVLAHKQTVSSQDGLLDCCHCFNFSVHG